MGSLARYYRIGQAAGVVVHVLPDGSQRIQLCIVHASGNQLEITKRVTDLTSLKQLDEYLPRALPVALVLTGKGILQKKIDKADTVDQNVFNSVLPNAKVQDFYVQNLVSGAYSFVSVIRKSDADKWISQLQEIQFNPLALSLGPYLIESILPQLNIYENEFIINGHHIVRNENGEWLDCTYNQSFASPFQFKLASEKLDERLIIPYAAAFQLVLINDIETVSADVADLGKALKKKLSDQKIKVQSTLILIILFSLLLINFILFSSLNSSNSELAGQVSRSAQNTSDQQEINKQVKSKEYRLNNLGWDGGTNKSLLVDQIASLLPREITLKEIAVNPVDLTRTRSQRSLVFYQRKMWITGTSEKIMPVNEWIARIKIKPWVKDIQIENFAFNSELNTGQFTITIDY
jgi:hypothetical protein